MMRTIEDLRSWLQKLFTNYDFNIKIDPEQWDTRLTVGPKSKQHNLLVDSRALCRASPVFRKLLSEPKAQKGIGRQKYQLTIPDHHNVLSFVMLMKLAHGQYEHTPLQLKPKHLMGVTRAAKEYDMMRSMRYVSRFWLEYISSGHKANKVGRGEVKRMVYVSWALGDKRIFRDSIDRLVRECTSDEQGELIDSVGDELNRVLYISDKPIYKHMKVYRKKRQDILIDACKVRSLRDLIQRHAQSPRLGVDIFGQGAQSCPVRDAMSDQDLQNIGALIVRASSHGLLHLFLGEPPRPEVLQMSLAELEQRLYAIFDVPGDMWHEGRKLHRDCLDKIKELSLVSNDDLRTLRNNAAVSRLDAAASKPEWELVGRPWKGWAEDLARGILDVVD